MGSRPFLIAPDNSRKFLRNIVVCIIEKGSPPTVPYEQFPRWVKMRYNKLEQCGDIHENPGPPKTLAWLLHRPAKRVTLPVNLDHTNLVQSQSPLRRCSPAKSLHPPRILSRTLFRMFHHQPPFVQFRLTQSRSALQHPLFAIGSSGFGMRLTGNLSPRRTPLHSPRRRPLRWPQLLHVNQAGADASPKSSLARSIYLRIISMRSKLPQRVSNWPSCMPRVDSPKDPPMESTGIQSILPLCPTRCLHWLLHRRDAEPQ